MTHVGKRRVHLIVRRHAAVETFQAANYRRPKIVRTTAGKQEEKKVGLRFVLVWNGIDLCWQRTFYAPQTEVTAIETIYIGSELKN